MGNTVDKVIKIATAEVGYLEKSAAAYKKDSTCLDEKTRGAGSDNYTKYGRDMHKVYPAVMDFPAYWCDAFVDWCFYKAYGVSNAKKLLGGNFDDYTVASCQLYKNKKALDTTPTVGSQVFFTKNGQISGCYHTGLVYDVDKTCFYTIEGNTSGASGVVSNGGGVAKKKYSISSYKGKVLFGHPKYDTKTTTKSEKVDLPKLASSTPNLKKGSTGTQVKYLQKDLNYLGYKGKDGKNLTIDGSFGANTENALRAFQKKNGLTVDGIYGKISKSKMKSLLI
ncbi:MAG: peptidoglycan-binding protein [Lachnospiraceae bacterium]|nr:peptidoglycan-binding protein [Lachnospiraceae bacterium]